MSAIPAPPPVLPGLAALQAAGSPTPAPYADPAAGATDGAAASGSAFSSVLLGLGTDCSLPEDTPGAGTGTCTTSPPVQEPVPALFSLADSARPGVQPPPAGPPGEPAAGESLPLGGQSLPPDDLDTLLDALDDLQSIADASEAGALPATAAQLQPLPLTGPVPAPLPPPDSAGPADELPGESSAAGAVAAPAADDAPVTTARQREPALADDTTGQPVRDTADPVQESLPRDPGTIDRTPPAEFHARLQTLVAPLEQSVPQPDAATALLSPSHAGTTNPPAANVSTTAATDFAFADLPALEPRADQQAWSRGLGERLLMMVEKGRQSATLRLQPEQLGPLQIRIRIDEDGASQVLFSAHHAQTREALEQAMPRLRELFAEQGLNLAQADVDSGRGTFTGHHFTTPWEPGRHDAGTDGEAGETQTATLWQLRPASTRRVDVLI